LARHNIHVLGEREGLAYGRCMTSGTVGQWTNDLGISGSLAWPHHTHAVKSRGNLRN